MGIDVAVVLDHSLSRDDLLRLDELIDVDRLRSLPTGLGEAVRFQWALDRPFVSPGEQLQAIGHVDFDAPGFLGTVYDTAVQVHSVTRWASFLTEDLAEATIREAATYLAGVLGSRFAIYLPDSACRSAGALDVLHDGRPVDVDELLDWLTANVGDAAERPRDIYSETETTWDGDGYFVERYAG